ncbi:MAG: tetratricopeptide repeat protein [Planctomycetes bacterium]|nr:tetratricopeptide repeat protein [Planctomycetota bacterium]
MAYAKYCIISITIILVCFLAVSSLFPDDAIAREFIAKGDESLKKGEFPRALEFYQKALKESPEMPEVHFKIGEAHLKMDEKPRCRQAFKKCISLIDGLAKPSLVLIQLKKKAEEILNKLKAEDPSSKLIETEGRAIEQEYIKQLLGFTRKNRAKDNFFSEQALKRILKLDPKNSEAKKMYDEIVQGVFLPRWKPLPMGELAADWLPENPNDWDIEDGNILVAKLLNKGSGNRRKDLWLEGDFTVALDFRVDETLESRPGPYSAGIMLGDRTGMNTRGISVVDEKVVKLVGVVNKERKEFSTKPLPDNYKKGEWNQLKVEISQGDLYRIYINNNLVIEYRTEVCGGVLAIWAQLCQVRFKDIKLLK